MTKISDTSALTGAGVDQAVDLLPIVDMSEAGTARNKKITITELLGLAFSNEQIDDRVAALLTAGTNVTLNYDDGAGTLEISAAVASGDITDFNEAVDDRVGALIDAGTGISVVYNDGAGTLVITNTASIARNVSFPIIATPGASEVLLMWTPPVGETVTFADDFADSAGITVGNPGSTYTMPVKKDGASVGSIEVSAAGAFTFSTTGGAVTIIGGTNYLTVEGSATPDAAFENATITLKGSL